MEINPLTMLLGLHSLFEVELVYETPRTTTSALFVYMKRAKGDWYGV